MTTHLCLYCLEMKPEHEFGIYRGYRRGKCKECRNHNTYHYKEGNKYYIRIVVHCMIIYGLRCEKCECDDMRLLQFHHRDGKGKKFEGLRKIRQTESKIPEIQLLCANHHVVADIEDNTNRRGVLLGKAQVHLDWFLDDWLYFKKYYIVR